MQVFSTYETLPEAARGVVAALGNFDGVHRGHAALLGAARRVADDLGVPLAVVTFEPHPRRYFCPNDPPFRLTEQDRKRQLLEKAGVDIVYELPFTPRLAGMDADAFVETVLVNGIGARGVAAGADFRFGRGREGSLALLRRAGRFAVVETPPVLDAGGIAISSSRVREALAGADPRQAARLLGREWDIPYVVVEGDKRGRELGYPTANGRLGELLRPAYGIYAVRARTADGKTRNGVASLGIRPMWQSAEPLIETHIFDFSGDLYGQILLVSLVEYLRPEVKFEGIPALLQQIAIDCTQANAALALTIA